MHVNNPIALSSRKLEETTSQILLTMIDVQNNEAAGLISGERLETEAE
jgi:hypothetical protein